MSDIENWYNGVHMFAFFGIFSKNWERKSVGKSLHTQTLLFLSVYEASIHSEQALWPSLLFFHMQTHHWLQHRLYWIKCVAGSTVRIVMKMMMMMKGDVIPMCVVQSAEGESHADLSIHPRLDYRIT